MAKFVSYLRVSTAKQGQSGLGLEAQREAVAIYLQSCGGEHVAELVEVESGKRSDRPKLAEAMRLCRVRRATLLIAKLDRLARNVAFIANLMEADADFVAVDMPQANRFTVHIMAAVAEQEADAISKRTKAALAAAKARGVQLGRKACHAELVSMSAKGKAAATAARVKAANKTAADVLPTVADIRATAGQELSLRQLAAELNARGERTPRGGQWSAVQVMRLLARNAAYLPSLKVAA